MEYTLSAPKPTRPLIEHHKDKKNIHTIQIYFAKVINKKLLITLWK